MSVITRLDACPLCHPGLPDAAPAIGAPQPHPDGMVTDHQCGTCETAWSTLWGRDGWPIDRTIAPVSPDQASRNRVVLEEATRGEAA